MSEIEKGIELTLKIYEKVKDDKIAELEQAYAKGIQQREAQLNVLRTEIAWLHEKNNKMENTNRKLEMEKKDYEDGIKEAEKKFISDLKAMARAHTSELSQIKEKCRIVTERALAEAKQSQALLDRTICLREKADNELKCFKEDLKEKNIEIFKEVLARFGCLQARAIAQTFQEVEIFDEDGKLRPDGKIVVNNSRRCWPFIKVYNHRLQTCYNCKYPHLKQKCENIRTTECQCALRN